MGDTPIESARPSFSDDATNSNTSLPVSGATTPITKVQVSLDAMDLYQRLASLSESNAVPRSMISSDDIVKLVPRDSEGNLTSIGTISHYLHPIGEKCKPCLFWFQEVCHRGETCL